MVHGKGMNMGIINYKREKGKTVKESGFKVGDILVGNTYVYRNVTYWYQIIGMTDKQLKLKRLNVCYPTKYMSNTPGDECMPVLEFVNEKLGIRDYFPAAGFPYWMKMKEGIIYKASIDLVITTEEFMDRTDEIRREYEAHIIGDRYAPTLDLWDGRPGWVNCD